LDLTSSVTQEQNTRTFSLPSSVISDIFTDTSLESSELEEITHVTSPDTATQSAIAPSGDLRTVKEMSNQGLAVKHQSDALIANIRGHRDRTKLLVHEPAIKLAKILPISAAAPLMQFPPTTRAIGPTGRIRVRVNNQSLSELLGWVVGRQKRVDEMMDGAPTPRITACA
jgi:hypothetical protein